MIAMNSVNLMPLAITPRFAAELSALLTVSMTAVVVALSLMAVVGALRRARGTTLVAPLIWTLVSLGAIGAELIAWTQAAAVAGIKSADNDKWWLLVVTSTFCPLVSLLGAKRPQHRAWQWIVLSFWIVAALPAIQGLVFQPSERLEVPIVWRCFYAALLLLLAVNYLPTRFAPASLLVTIGEAQLLWPYLPLTSAEFLGGFWRGITILCVGICGAWLTSHFRFRRQRGWRNETASLAAWTRVWLDFRDAYGLVWGARVWERIEALLQSNEVPAWLEWTGFRSPALEADRMHAEASAPAGENETAANSARDAATLGDPIAPMEAGIRNLLRRFVSSEWIDQRLTRQP
jgi:hypothetical protein